LIEQTLFGVSLFDMQCDSLLRETIRHNLENFRGIAGAGNKAAAVALVVVEQGYGANLDDLEKYQTWQRSAALILTTRSRKLKNHPGQWALPGGRIDPNETAETASLREAEEEIDLKLDKQDMLGRLDDFVTRSGFVMTPIVFWGGTAKNITPNPHEVESIHRIPIEELMRKDAPMLNYDEIDNREKAGEENHPVLRMPIGQKWIAAPTAAVLYQFREVCILGRETRVAHFDQPRFAWR